LLNVFEKTLKHRVKLIRDDSIKNGNPTIYVATHIMYDDITAICYCLKENAYVLFGHRKALWKTSKLDYMGLFLNGRIFVDRNDKADRAQSKLDMAKVLRNGGNILAFPEGTWNFSPNLLVLPVNWGILDSARLADRSINIVPIAFDLVANEYCVIIGKGYEVLAQSNYSKGAFMEMLRDDMATLMWELIEMTPPINRLSLPEKYWIEYTNRQCATIKMRDQHKEDLLTYRPKEVLGLGELLAEMHGIEYKSMAADYETHRRIERLIDGWTSRLGSAERKKDSVC